jgi:hypothetical protein
VGDWRRDHDGRRDEKDEPRRLSMKPVVVLVVALVCLAGAGTAQAKGGAPRVTEFSFSPSTFAVASAHAASTGHGRVTTLRFRLSERATVRIAIARKLAGRRSHGRCVKSTAKLRKHRACSRYVTTGRLVRTKSAGRTTIAFSGRINGKALKTGAYRATIVAIDKSKHHSRPKRATFTVVSAAASTESPGGKTNPSPGSGSTTATACASSAKNVRDGFDPWGGCFPGPSNTGVPVGTVLANYTGPCTITAPNTVIDSKTVNCDLTIQAANVTVRNSKVNGSIVTADQGGSVTVTDTTIDAGEVNQTVNDGPRAICCRNFTAVRIQALRGISGGFCEYYCEVRDSFICCQDRDEGGAAHESGMRLGSGTQPNSQRLIHNTIRCDGPDVPPDAGCSADITGYGDFDYIQNNLVQRNLLEWTPTGGYCAYGGSTASKPYPTGSNNTWVDNIFQRGPNRKCGVYGAMIDLAAGIRGNTWTNNRWDSGELMPSNG